MCRPNQPIGDTNMTHEEALVAMAIAFLKDRRKKVIDPVTRENYSQTIEILRGAKQ